MEIAIYALSPHKCAGGGTRLSGFLAMGKKATGSS